MHQLEESLQLELSTKLDLTLNSHCSGRGRDYDAVLLLSGGKDSVYLVHELMRLYPQLRLLTCAVNSGFLSPAAEQNISNTVKRLNLAHITVTPQASIFQKAFRHAFINLKGRKCYDMIDRIDGDLVYDTGRHVAASMGIPLLISGLSWAQVERVFAIKSFEIPRELEERKRTETAGFLLNDLCNGHELNFWWDPTKYAKHLLPRVIFPFYVWRHNEQHIRQRVVELKLIKEGFDSPIVTNNLLIPFMAVIDVLNHGYSSFEPELSQLVREHKTKRSLWLNVFELSEYSAKTGFFLGKYIDDTLAMLNVTRKDIGLEI